MAIELTSLSNTISVSNDGKEIGISSPGVGFAGALSDQNQLVYVSKIGDDSDSGLNIEDAKLTIGAAITVATALTPTVSNQITVQIVDTGDYIEEITLPEWVHLFGPNASTSGRITVSNNCIVTLRRSQNTLTTSQCIRKLDEGGLSKISVDLMVVTAGQEGVRCDGGLIGLTIGAMTLDGAEGLLAKNGSRMTFNIQYVLMVNTSEFMITTSGSGGANSFYGEVLRVEDDNTSRFIKLNVNGDMVDVQGGSVAVLKLYNLSDSAILNLYVNTSTGTRIEGTGSQANIMDLAGDSLLRGDLKVIGDLLGFTSGSFRIVTSFDDLDEFKTGSVYNLPAAAYFFATPLVFGTDTINLNDINSIYSFYGSNFSQLSYTGTTPFISTDKTGVSIDVVRMFLNTPNATCISLTNFNSCILEFPVFNSCKLCVDLDTGAFFTNEVLVMVGCENGCIIKDVGTMSARIIQWSVGQNAAGAVAITLMGAAGERCFISQSDSRVLSNESFFDIQADYAGLVDLVAGVHTNGAAGDFFKSGTRNQNDKDISVSAIQNVTSSHSTVAIHVADGDEVQTSITDGVETVIAGTYTTDIAQRFTVSGARVTYTGNETDSFGLALKCLCSNASGNNRDYDLFIKKNSTTLVPITLDKVNCDAGTPAKATCIGSVELSTGDFLDPIIIGISTSNNDVTCSALAFIVG